MRTKFTARIITIIIGCFLIVRPASTGHGKIIRCANMFARYACMPVVLVVAYLFILVVQRADDNTIFTGKRFVQNKKEC